MTERDKPQPGGEILLYRTEDGQTRLETHMTGDTVWLSLGQMATLFQRDKSVVSRHIRNVFEEGELERDRVVANLATTAADGKTYQVEYHNLDVIISVGYRVKSHRGVQFRIWATRRLREYIVKGYWAVDFDYMSRKEIIRVAKDGGEENDSAGTVEYEERWTGGYIFENEWQSFRTRKNRDLELASVPHAYAKAGRHTVAVKVIDIFGNDTMTLVPVNVG